MIVHGGSALGASVHGKMTRELCGLSEALNDDISAGRTANLTSYPPKLGRVIEIMKDQDFVIKLAKNCNDPEYFAWVDGI